MSTYYAAVTGWKVLYKQFLREETCGLAIGLVLYMAKTPGRLIQPMSGYHSCRHTLLLEGNLTIGKAFCASMFVIAAAAESWKDHAIYFENLMIPYSYVCGMNSWRVNN